MANSKSKVAWTKNPTKKQVFVFSALGVVSFFLIIVSITDFFSRSFFQRGYFTIYFMMIVVTGIWIRLFRNYRKNKSSE